MLLLPTHCRLGVQQLCQSASIPTPSNPIFWRYNRRAANSVIHVTHRIYEADICTHIARPIHFLVLSLDAMSTLAHFVYGATFRRLHVLSK